MSTYTKEQLALIEEHRNWNVEHIDWHDSTIEHFIQTAKDFGIETDGAQISFSGFWSQGDGASFTFDRAKAYDVIMAHVAIDQNPEYNSIDEMTDYVKEFYALGTRLLERSAQNVYASAATRPPGQVST